MVVTASPLGTDNSGETSFSSPGAKAALRVAGRDPDGKPIGLGKQEEANGLLKFSPSPGLHKKTPRQDLPGRLMANMASTADTDRGAVYCRMPSTDSVTSAVVEAGPRS